VYLVQPWPDHAPLKSEFGADTPSARDVFVIRPNSAHSSTPKNLQSHGEMQAELVRDARSAALVMVLCDVLADVPATELALALGAGESCVPDVSETKHLALVDHDSEAKLPMVIDGRSGGSRKT
jgi:hypothetical protein